MPSLHFVEFVEEVLDETVCWLMSAFFPSKSVAEDPLPSALQTGFEVASLRLQEEELGIGAFGSVRRGFFHDSAVAVKLLDHHAHDCSVPKEVILRYLARLKHQRTLQLHACFFHESKLLIVTELIPGRDLESNLEILNKVSDACCINELRFFASQIVLATLHRKLCWQWLFYIAIV